MFSKLKLKNSNDPRIFLIGFNRCATRTITTFFRDNGYPSIHWGRGSVAAGIEAAIREGKAPLTYTPNFVVYGDLEYVSVKKDSKKIFKKRAFRKLFANLTEEEFKPIYAYKRYKNLDKHYPGSKFILNVRNVDDWIASRIRFLENGYYACDHGWEFHDSQIELNECWKVHWHEHVSDVKEYFSSRQDDLLEFNLDEHGPEAFVDFFPAMNLNVELWGHYHKTKPD